MKHHITNALNWNRLKSKTWGKSMFPMIYVSSAKYCSINIRCHLLHFFYDLILMRCLLPTREPLHVCWYTFLFLMALDRVIHHSEGKIQDPIYHSYHLVFQEVIGRETSKAYAYVDSCAMLLFKVWSYSYQWDQLKFGLWVSSLLF